jgi:uncharacterized membrane protein YhaH (DUF805 family)
MLGTLFYPDGRIGPVAFRNAALVLIAIGACMGLMPLLWPSFFLSLISLVMLYPWAVIWVKRFHDAGKSGWMFLAVFVPWLAVQMTAGWFISRQFGMATPPPGTPPAEIFAHAAAQMQAIAVPGAISSTVIALAVALVVNEELKSQPGENRFGSPDP